MPPSTNVACTMTAVTFDTHAFIKKLTAVGLSEPQAETITMLVQESRATDLTNIVTKPDLQAALAETKVDLLKVILGAIAINSGIVVGTMFGLAKLLGH